MKQERLSRSCFFVCFQNVESASLLLTDVHFRGTIEILRKMHHYAERNRMKKKSEKKLKKGVPQYLEQPSPIAVRESSPDEGLSEDEVRLRAEHDLANTPVESPTKTEKQIILQNSLTFFNFIFVFLAACLVAVGSYKDMLFLIIAVANTLIGIFQEIRSKRTIDKMTLMSVRRYTAIRGGRKVMIPSENLVRDDIVEFGPGDQICADAIVVSGQAQLNEALVTGEADQIDKRIGDALLSGRREGGVCPGVRIGNQSKAALQVNRGIPG